MSDLRDLYQQVIIDHSKNPRNKRAMSNATTHVEGFNPLCGDKVVVYLKLNDNIIEDVSFEGSGCAISTASISMLTEMLKGKTREEASEVYNQFHDMLIGKEDASKSKLDKLEIFAGVQEFPMRVKCATLAWHTFKAALDNKNETVSTE